MVVICLEAFYYYPSPNSLARGMGTMVFRDGKSIAVCEPGATAVCGQEPLSNTRCAEALLPEEGVASGSQVPTFSPARGKARGLCKEELPKPCEIVPFK